MPSDHDLVNFEEDYELDYILKRIGKRQTEKNRTLLRQLGANLKQRLGKRTLTHAELFAEAKKHLSRFE